MNQFKKIAKANIENQNRFELNGISFTVVSRANSGFSLDDICSFQNAIFNVHELARKRYSKTKSEDDAIIAIDAIKFLSDISRSRIIEK